MAKNKRYKGRFKNQYMLTTSQRRKKGQASETGRGDRLIHLVGNWSGQREKKEALKKPE